MAHFQTQKRHFFLLIFLTIAILPVCRTVLAQSGVATVAAEASVYEDQADDNGGSYSLFCIGNQDTDETRRAFVRFTLPAIPSGATVTRVMYQFLQDRVRNQGAGPLSANIEMRRALQDWEEGSGVQGMGPCGGGSQVPGVTWNTAPGVSGAVSATEFLPATNSTLITIDTDIGSDDDGLIDDIQAWVDNPGTNFGWEYRVAEEGTADNARRMEPGSMTIHWTVLQGGVMIVKGGIFDPGGNGVADPGDMIDYTLVVSNTGDVTLTQVAVTDPLLSGVGCPGGNPIPSLAPGAMESCTGSYAITQNDIDNGEVNNTASVVGQCSAANCPVNDADSHTEVIPAGPLEFSSGFEAPVP